MNELSTTTSAVELSATGKAATIPLVEHTQLASLTPILSAAILSDDTQLAHWNGFVRIAA